MWSKDETEQEAEFKKLKTSLFYFKITTPFIKVKKTQLNRNEI